MTDPQERLTNRLEEMAGRGLVDVKFLLRNPSEATTGDVLQELEEMYAAHERGESKILDFKDSYK